MKKRLADLACRRARLLETIELQRMDVAEISRRWQKPLAIVDTGLKVARFINRHHAWIGGCVVAVLAMRRKGISGLTQEMRRMLQLHPSPVLLAIRSRHEESDTEKK